MIFKYYRLADSLDWRPLNSKVTPSNSGEDYSLKHNGVEHDSVICAAVLIYLCIGRSFEPGCA